jgi:trehalose/maltose hydrolase-like predicted phosphorylase
VDALTVSHGIDRRFEAALVSSTLWAASVPVLAERLQTTGMTVLTCPTTAMPDRLEQLWRDGIGPGDVLVIVADTAATEEWTEIDEPGSSPAVVTIAVDAVERVESPLEEQLERRRTADLPAASGDPGWSLRIERFDPDHERVHEALLSIADGRSGTSGAPVVSHPDTTPWVLVGGVYDGDGPDTHLLLAPVGTRLPCELSEEQPVVRRVLDLHAGILSEHVTTEAGEIDSVRFSSLAGPGTVWLRARCPADPGSAPILLPPLEPAATERGSAGDVEWMQVRATTGGITAAAAQRVTSPNGGAVFDRVVVYEGHPDLVPEPTAAVDRVRHARTEGFDQQLSAHRRAWAERWEDADILIEGDAELQLATRFSLFQLMASVAGDGEAAVGARGISGPGYRGHVFWDADTFVLPFFAATHPPSARAMLEYRIRRLPAAVEAARAAGRSGARFPWESARAGDDVTPTSAKDRAGHTVAIRTGLSEEHIVADVAWAACCYIDWTGDTEFAEGPGLELLLETARYWASRIRTNGDRFAHLYAVIGPDEYHESVDDNAYTNVMARWNLRRAAAAAEAAERRGEPARADAAERARWRQLADKLVDNYDADSGLYEQFSGFSRLEPLIIEEVAPRRPIAADLLLGAERVRRSQIIKQADVLMLHHLVPDEVEPGSLDPNLRFYEPRTAHGSSLSPAIHASLFARSRDYGRALDALRIASRIDLDDLTGSTAAGLHVATMGGLWQAFGFGFAGFQPRPDRLRIDPRLPHAWAALELRVRFHGNRLVVRIEHGLLTLTASGPTPVIVGDLPLVVGPAGVGLHRRGSTWELDE